jgi:multidrug resistance efflux pump
MDNASPILPQETPAWILQAIAWLLGIIALAATIVAVTVELPETVRCPFVLVSEQGDEAMLSPLPAVLIQVNVTEGAEVARGATLFVLQSDEIRSWHTQRATHEEDLRALQARGAKLDEIQVAQQAIKEAQLVQLQREAEFRQKHVATNREFLASMEKLDAAGGAPKIDMMNHRLNLAASEKDLLLAEKARLQGTLELEQLQAERARQRIDEAADTAKGRIRLAALTQQLEQCEGDRMFIRAPYDAVVVALDRRSGGNWVQAGQSLAHLARRGGQPHARLKLEEAALARLQAGQRVRFYFEAYPYQRYGSATGRLGWITPAAVPAQPLSQFEAVASLDAAALPGGVAAERLLRVGMKGEARIVVGRRTLVEHIAEPIRQLRENLRP